MMYINSPFESSDISHYWLITEQGKQLMTLLVFERENQKLDSWAINPTLAQLSHLHLVVLVTQSYLVLY